MSEECCGTCKYHRRSSINGEWICDNEFADAFGLETTYGDCCEDYESRDE